MIEKDEACRPQPTDYPQVEENSIAKTTIGSIKSGFVQWQYSGNTVKPIGETTRTLPPGVYDTKWDNSLDRPVPISKNIDIDELFILPMPVLGKIINDIKSFWNNKDKYSQYGSVYKRGILLYGIPGCGKSSVIMLLSKELITNHNGIVLMPQDEDHLIWTFKVLPDIKEIEPDKKIIIVLEDIDSFVREKGSYSETSLINFLDGAGSVDGVVTIATTNSPEKLQERITNRPSRFDRRYEVGKPNAETRRFYIEHKLKKSDISDINIDHIIDKTEGFTIDHLKEYLLSVFVLGYSHEEAMEDVTEILGTRIIKNTKNNKDLGFKTK